MSRSAPALAALALCTLAACATPGIRLTPRFVVGEERVYGLQADVTSTVDTGGQRRTERSEIEGRSTIDVRSVSGDETTLRLSLAFDRFLRDGKPEEYEPQTAEIVVGANGAVQRVSEVGGLPVDVTTANVEEFARLLAIPMPTHRVELGDRWTFEAGPGQRQAGRLRALRVEGGKDCAIASMTTARTVQRSSAEEAGQVLLTGTETASSEVAFAFREGFPVAIRTDTQGIFDIASPSIGGGSLTILSHATLTLLSRTL